MWVMRERLKPTGPNLLSFLDAVFVTIYNIFFKFDTSLAYLHHYLISEYYITLLIAQ